MVDQKKDREHKYEVGMYVVHIIPYTLSPVHIDK